MEIKFANNGRITAAKITNYLLEKSRVVKQGEGERNYHIFYQICAGMPDDKKAELGLDIGADKFSYLSMSNCMKIDGVSDAHEFQDTWKAMKQLKFKDDSIESVWRVLALILHLGNLKIVEGDKESSSRITNEDGLARCANLMEINPTLLQTGLCFKVTKVRSSVSYSPLKVVEAEDARDALSKALYGKLFDWLIVRINQSICLSDARATIGILDIFGFEVFESNAFEQFCINYANEKLQQLFNNHIFKLEQQEYKEENIDFSAITFVDNIECLNLIEKRPVGILSMLDEEVVMPKGSDETLIAKMHKAFGEGKEKHAFYDADRRYPSVFIIKHYAGNVTYQVEGFLNKNRDKLHDSLTGLIKTAGNAFVKELFADDEDMSSGAQHGSRTPMGMGRGSTSSPSPSSRGSTKKTLGAQFAGQLAALMATLSAAEPHYIRCIKPNHVKQPQLFDTPMILRQMTYAGLFEAIRIRKSGFPFRQNYYDFVARYRCTLEKPQLRELLKLKSSGERQQCEFLLKALSGHLDQREWQAGNTKLFMRASQRMVLMRLRDRALSVCCVRIQAFYRMHRARKLYKELKAFSDECKAAILSRQIDTLQACLSKAEENDYVLFVLTKVKALHAFLTEERRVCRLLEQAIAARRLDMLDAALTQAAQLARSAPQEKMLPLTNEVLVAANALKSTLLRMERAREALRDALLTEDVATLEAAINEGQAAGLSAAEIDNASATLEQWRYEVECIEYLTWGTDNDDTEVLEKGLAMISELSLDAKQKKVLMEARNCLAKLYRQEMQEAIKAKSEAQLRDNLLPKLVQWQFATLEGDVRAFLERGERPEFVATDEQKAPRMSVAGRASVSSPHRPPAHAPAAAAAPKAAALMPNVSEEDEHHHDDDEYHAAEAEAALRLLPRPGPAAKDRVVEAPKPATIKIIESRELRLQEAIGKRDTHLLEFLMDEAKKDGDESKCVQKAGKVLQRLQEEQKLLDKLHEAVHNVEPELIRAVLHDCTRLGIKVSDKIVSKARHYTYGITSNELLRLQIRRAIEKEDMPRLRKLRVAAKTERFEGSELKEIDNVLASHAMSQMAAGGTGGMGALQEAWNLFIPNKGAYPLGSCPILRNEGNYAKRNYFSKSTLKETRLVWQNSDIPRSLVKISTAYCANNKVCFGGHPYSQ
jgi:myosin heavy subunit